MPSQPARKLKREAFDSLITLILKFNHDGSTGIRTCLHIDGCRCSDCFFPCCPLFGLSFSDNPQDPTDNHGNSQDNGSHAAVQIEKDDDKKDCGGSGPRHYATSLYGRVFIPLR